MRDTDTTQTPLGALFKRRREALGMRQDEVASAAEMTPTYLCNVERQKKQGLSAQKLIRLAVVLKLSPRRVIRQAMWERTADLREALRLHEAEQQRTRRATDATMRKAS